MNPPVRNNADSATNSEQITVSWTPISDPDNGNAIVTSYSLEYDAGTEGGSWTAVVGYLSDFTGTTAVVTQNIERGKTYQFRLRAKNKWGWGAYSSTTSVKAARRPLQITTVSNSVDQATGDLLISWQAPDNQGDPISAYTVLIQNAVSLDWLTHTDCSATSLDNLNCYVPMSELEGGVTYGYVQGQQIETKVYATNQFGDGDQSDTRVAETTLRVKPYQMLAPTRNVTTTPQEIVIDWLEPTGSATGDSAILSYHV